MTNLLKEGVSDVYIDWNTIIVAGSVVSAALLLLGVLAKVYDWYLKQAKQDEKIDELKAHHEEDVKRIKEENCLICFALSACLDGLQQLGANHTVPVAKTKLDKYLNEQAHE